MAIPDVIEQAVVLLESSGLPWHLSVLHDISEDGFDHTTFCPDNQDESTSIVIVKQALEIELEEPYIVESETIH